VFASVHKLLLMLGQFDSKKKQEMFIETNTATSFVQNYVKSQDNYFKKMNLDILVSLLKDKDSKVSKQLSI
jgi:peptidase E